MAGRMDPEVAARNRRANRAAFYTERRARASGPIERAAAAWDHWRGLVRELPEGERAGWADVITRALELQITQITQILDGGAR